MAKGESIDGNDFTTVTADLDLTSSDYVFVCHIDIPTGNLPTREQCITLALRMLKEHETSIRAKYEATLLEIETERRKMLALEG